MLCADRPFLAIADRIEHLRVYAKAGKVVFRRVCSLLTKRQVVINGASLVTVSFYSYLGIGIGLEPVEVLFEYVCITRPDVVPVKIKVNIVQDWSCC